MHRKNKIPVNTDEEADLIIDRLQRTDAERKKEEMGVIMGELAREIAREIDAEILAEMKILIHKTPESEL